MMISNITSGIIECRAFMKTCLQGECMHLVELAKRIGSKQCLPKGAINSI